MVLPSILEIRRRDYGRSGLGQPRPFWNPIPAAVRQGFDIVEAFQWHMGVWVGGVRGAQGVEAGDNGINFITYFDPRLVGGADGSGRADRKRSLIQAGSKGPTADICTAW